jgi:hypothetical protein
MFSASYHCDAPQLQFDSCGTLPNDERGQDVTLAPGWDRLTNRRIMRSWPRM